MTEVTSYTELIRGVDARRIELGIRQQDFEKLAGLSEGLAGRVFGPAQVKRLGPEKLFDVIRAAGLKLRLEPDPVMLARMQKQIAENCVPMQANQARNGNHSSPVSTALLSRCFKHLSRLGVKARMKKMTKKQRSEHARHAINTRWKKERKRKKAARSRRQRLKVAESVTVKQFRDGIGAEVVNERDG